MKKYSIIYWTATALFAAFMLMSAYSYLTAPEMKAAFAGLGFTEDYFRIELAIAKLLGALALLLPFTPRWLKGFAYAGFAINIISALVAHIAMNYNSYALLIYSVVTLSVSYYAYRKLQNQISHATV